jgi:tetrahydromethanopterin S-methyltransferase subunit G
MDPNLYKQARKCGPKSIKSSFNVCNKFCRNTLEKSGQQFGSTMFRSPIQACVDCKTPRRKAPEIWVHLKPEIWVQFGSHLGSDLGPIWGAIWGAIWVQFGERFGERFGSNLGVIWGAIWGTIWGAIRRTLLYYHCFYYLACVGGASSNCARAT